jgi:hypothetical protein
MWLLLRESKYALALTHPPAGNDKYGPPTLMSGPRYGRYLRTVKVHSHYAGSCEQTAQRFQLTIDVKGG